jgi:hypothetical protein
VSNPLRHVLNGIYLNSFDTKDKKDGRVKEMEAGCRNKRN